MELTQEQINQLKSRGLTDSDISSLAQSKGYKLPSISTVMPSQKSITTTSTPVTRNLSNNNILSDEQIKQLTSKGLSESDIQSLAQKNGYSLPKQIGGFQSVVQSVAKPFLKTATSLMAIPAAFDGNQATLDSINKEGIDYGYFGKAKPVGAGFDIAGPVSQNIRPLAESAGTGLEIASWLIGAPEAKTVIQTGLKGLISQGAKEGAVLGATTGTEMSFGQALQEADSQPADIAYKTLFGTAFGAIGGTVLGAIAPIIVKGVSGGANFSKKFTNVSEVNQELYKLNQQVFAPTKTQLKNFGSHDTIQTYTDIFGTKLPEVDKNNRFLKESVTDFANQVNDVYKPASEAFGTILRNSPEVVSLNEVKNAAIADIQKSSLTPSSKTKALEKIDTEFSALKQEAASRGWLKGDDNLPVFYADNFKDIFWGATRNFGTEESTIANAVNRNTGFAFKNAIENAVDDINVRQFNNKLGDLITLRDFLEDIAGKKSGTGGPLTRLIAGRLVGTIAGSAGGGLPGAIAGNITGDLLARMMTNPELQPYRWIINKRLSQLPKAEIMRLEEEANQVLQQMFKKRIETLALPAPKSGTSLINQGRPIPVVPAGAEFVGGDTAIQSRSSSAMMKEPTTNPTTIVNKKAINQTVPQNTNSASAPAITNNTSSRIIDSSVPQKKGIFQRLIDKFKNTPNKQGGFIKIGSSKPSITPELVAKRIDATDLKLLRSVIDSKSADAYIKAGPMFDAMGIGKLDVKTQERFIKEVIDLSTKNLKVKSIETPLIQEAKKYKSAEEFVKAQGTPVFHGTGNGEFSMFDPKKIGTGIDSNFNGRGDYGQGFNFTASFDDAKAYAKNAGKKPTVIEAYLSNKNPLDLRKVSKIEQEIRQNIKNAGYNILNAPDSIYTDTYKKYGLTEEKFMKIKDILNASDEQDYFAPDMAKMAKKMGFDSIIAPNGEITIFDSNQIKTKSQLTDIWNKANKK